MKQKRAAFKPSQSISQLRHALLLVTLSFAVYGNSLVGDFVWDDHLQVVRNGNIRTLGNVPRAFISSLWSFMHTEELGSGNAAFDQYYRPLQTTIYALTYQLGGLSPVAYHFVNLTLHAAATVLVYMLCLQVGLGNPTGLIAGAFFAVHPVHTEAVSWIAGVGDLECAVFYFGAISGFLRYVNSRRPGWLWFSSMCFLAAMFSKEMAATLPFLILLLLWMRRKELKLERKAVIHIMSPYLLAMGVYAAFRLIAVGAGLSSVSAAQLTTLDWGTLAIWVMGQYLRYAVAPYPLFIYHLVPPHFSGRILSTFAYAAFLAAVTLALWILRRRIPHGLFWVAMFGVSLAPVLYFKGISGSVFFAERYLYIPSLPMVILMAILLVEFGGKRVIIAASCLIAVFSALTIQRNRDWRTEEALYRRTLEWQPEAVNMWTSLGEVYLKRNENSRAREYFEKALQHTNDSRFVQAKYEEYRIHLQLGTVAAREGKPEEAKTHLHRALEIYPGEGAYAQLGAVLINVDHDYKSAMPLLEEAIKLSATSELARDYMGVAFYNQGQYDQAVKYFREALAINPDYPPAKQHLELALQAKRP